ncbi:hypothetical protein K438DRAFT_1219724 [Mycena galopus ATCC 62051]|nr:hypothetical protein K438DRAFT_1219724 [Mycena galopus ATCC 62051]
MDSSLTDVFPPSTVLLVFPIFSMLSRPSDPYLFMQIQVVLETITLVPGYHTTVAESWTAIHLTSDVVVAKAVTVFKTGLLSGIFPCFVGSESFPMLNHKNYPFRTLRRPPQDVPLWQPGPSWQRTDPDAEAARQLTRALTMTRAGATVSWENTLRRLGLDVDSAAQDLRAEEWNQEWEDILADSVKRKRRKKMKKHNCGN